MTTTQVIGRHRGGAAGAIGNVQGYSSADFATEHEALVDGGYTPDTGRGPSPAIWADCPILLMQEDPGFGHYFFDDFVTYPATAINTHNGTYLFNADTGGTCLHVDDETGTASTATLPNQRAMGNIQFDGDGTAQDGHVLTYGAAVSSAAAVMRIARVDQTYGVWFEARLQADSVADDGSNLFCGLCNVDYSGTVADITLQDTTGDPDASQDFLGWYLNAGDGNGNFTANGKAMLPLIQQGGQTPVVANYGGPSPADLNSEIRVNTWFKVGFSIRNGFCNFYHDGVLRARAAVNLNATTTPTDWPTDSWLAMVLATKLGAGAAAVETTMDWWGLGYHNTTAASDANA